MVPFVFNFTTLGYVPLNPGFDQTTSSPQSKHRRASTLQDLKERIPMRWPFTTQPESLCVVKGKFLLVGRSGEAIQLGHATQVKGVSEGNPLNFELLFLDVFKACLAHDQHVPQSFTADLQPDQTRLLSDLTNLESNKLSSSENPPSPKDTSTDTET